MKEKLFIKSYKTNIPKYSWKYWLAITIEIMAIILWTIGILEMVIHHKFNPVVLYVHSGGLLFVIGSFIYAKCIKH